MTLQDYVNSGNVMSRVMANAPYPSIEVALISARGFVAEEATGNLALSVLGDVQAMYDMHCMFKGELADGARTFQVAEWSEQLEEKVTAYFDNRREVLSSSWLGTVDAKSPRNQKGVERIASEYAKEAYKNLTYIHDKDNGKEKTAAQVLSAVGITRGDLEPYVHVASPATIQTPEKENSAMQTIDVTPLIYELHTNAAMLSLTGKALHNVIDNASDDDMGLAASGFTALMVFGNVSEKHSLLTMYRRTYGLEALVKSVADNTNMQFMYTDKPADLSAFIGGSSSSQAVDESAALAAMMGTTPVVMVGAPPKATRAKRANVPGDESGVISAELLAGIRDATGVKSEELGALIGVSRATFDNYCKGKGKLYINDAVVGALIELVDSRVTMLKSVSDGLNTL